MRNFTNIVISEETVLNRLKQHCHLEVGYANRISIVEDVIYCHLDLYDLKIGSVSHYKDDNDITDGRINCIIYYPFYDKPSYIKINEKKFNIYDDNCITMAYEYLNTLLSIEGLG
jgi:hypothetical protein